MTRRRRPTRILIVIASLLLLLGGGLLSGCGAPRHTLLIVMLDETASFTATGQYQAALTWHNKAAKRGQKSTARDGAVIKAVKLLKSGDRYSCIGIDDQVDDSDVRLNLGEIKPHLSARKLFPRQLAILADFTNPAHTGIRRTSSGGEPVRRLRAGRPPGARRDADGALHGARAGVC